MCWQGHLLAYCANQDLRGNRIALFMGGIQKWGGGGGAVGWGHSQQGSVTTLSPLPIVHWGGEDFPIILQTRSVVACYGEEENYSDK